MNNNNWNVFIKNIENAVKPPSVDIVTIRPGRILWHARWQPMYGNRRNVMNSPDYLYTSPQISQVILHGIMITKPNTFIELTKLRVKKPIHVLNFKNEQEQRNYAIVNAGIYNFVSYSLNDIKLFSHICKDPNIDGYRAKWDQDQIALCAKAIRTKLEKVSTQNFTNKNIELRFGITQNNINFVTAKNYSTAYYRTANKRRGRQLVKSIKRVEKVKATRAKQNRTHLYRVLPHVKRYLKK